MKVSRPFIPFIDLDRTSAPARVELMTISVLADGGQVLEHVHALEASGNTVRFDC